MMITQTCVLAVAESVAKNPSASGKEVCRLTTKTNRASDEIIFVIQDVATALKSIDVASASDDATGADMMTDEAYEEAVEFLKSYKHDCTSSTFQEKLPAIAKVFFTPKDLLQAYKLDQEEMYLIKQEGVHIRKPANPQPCRDLCTFPKKISHNLYVFHFIRRVQGHAPGSPF